MHPLTKLFAALALAACPFAADAAARPPEARDKADTKRAEKILAKLSRLDEAAASRDERAHRSAVKKLFPGLFAEAARLREGDVKTDLTTAVFLHEAAYASRRAARPLADCGALLREHYRRLCREQSDTAHASFLRAAARLHAGWAAAAVAARRGAGDAAVLDALAEMRAARALDARLAERAVAALGRLAAEVNPHGSLHEFETRGDVARVSYEQFSADLAGALAEVDRVLAELPRGPLHLSLRNARHAFREGAAWWGDATRAEARTVAASSPSTRDPHESSRLPARAAGYTAVCDWRQAARALAEARRIIGGLEDAPPSR